MADSTDHITGKASLTLTITASKDGAAFASISPTVTDLGSGWYNLALTTTHTNTLGAFLMHITGSGADPTDVADEVCPDIPGNATVSGTVTADVTKWNGTTVATPDTAGYPKVTIKSGTGTGELNLSSGATDANVTKAAGTAWNSGAIGASTLATDTITAAKIAADAIGASELAADAVTEIAAGISVPSAATIADTILQRDSSNWEAGAAKKSLGAAVMAAVHKIDDDGSGHLIVYRSDGTTEHYRRTITTDASLQPIDSLTGAA